MPLSCLTWTRDRPALGAGRGRRRARGSPRARPPPPSPPRAPSSSSSALSAPIVSSGTCGKRRPICAASAPVATASRVAPPASAAVGAGVGAVAVAVGLDHRAELGALAQLALQPRAVALDGAEVDPGERPRHGPSVGDERGQRVGPRDQAGEAALAVDHGQVVVVLLGDRPGDRLGVVVGAGRRPGRGSSARETLVAKALLRRSSKPFIEPTKTIAAHDVEVVRQVEVGLLVAEDQVGLADDADDVAFRVDHRDRAHVGLGQQLDRRRARRRRGRRSARRRP